MTNGEGSGTDGKGSGTDEVETGADWEEIGTASNPDDYVGDYSFVYE